MKHFTKLILPTIVTFFFVTVSAGNASAGDVTCSGGSVASGVYSNLNIAAVSPTQGR